MSRLLHFSLGVNAALLLVMALGLGGGGWYLVENERNLADIRAVAAKLPVEVQTMRVKLAQERARREKQLPDCIRRQHSVLRCRQWIGI